MNIDDLERDIMELEELEGETPEVIAMQDIANAYYGDRKLCEELIMAFRIKYGVKLNIL